MSALTLAYRSTARADRTRRDTDRAVARRPAARLGEAGVPERQTRMRVGQLWHWLYVRGATDFAAHDQHRQGAARRRSTGSFTLARPEIVTEQVSNDGTRKWLLRFPTRPRTPGRDRDGLHPRRGARHALHLEPGRLHAHLHASAIPARRSSCAT